MQTKQKLCNASAAIFASGMILGDVISTKGVSTAESILLAGRSLKSLLLLLLLQVQHNYKKQDQLFHMVMQLPVALAAVSGAVQSILSQEFGRTSTIIPNSVDCDRFRPGPLSSHCYTAVLTAPVSEVSRAVRD